MRWFWIDRFEEMVSGKRAVAVKNVALAEEHLHDHFPAFPIMPHSLVVEGMAQTGGLLVGQSTDFTARVVLAKVSKVTFYSHPRPGDQLKYTAEIQDVREDGSLVHCTSHKNGELHAELEVVFGHLDHDDTERELFETGDFYAMLKSLRVFEVGVYEDGAPIRPPQHMLERERSQLEAAEAGY